MSTYHIPFDVTYGKYFTKSMFNNYIICNTKRGMYYILYPQYTFYFCILSSKDVTL